MNKGKTLGHSDAAHTAVWGFDNEIENDDHLPAWAPSLYSSVCET